LACAAARRSSPGIHLNDLKNAQRVFAARLPADVVIADEAVSNST